MMSNINSSKNNNGAEMDVLLDEIEVGIEPATISPKVSNLSRRRKRKEARVLIKGHTHIYM